MHDDASTIHRPAAPARQLVLLFHDHGGTPADLQSLGAAVAQHFDQAWVLSVRAPDVSDLGSGWQWFSMRGWDDANRCARVAQAMPRFERAVRRRQREAGLAASATTLIGFAQGAIMSLEATQLSERLAGRVVAIAGRFAKAPRMAPIGTALHVMHGLGDRVMPSRLSVDAAERLRSLGASVTLDLFPSLAHGIDERVLERVVQRMQGQAAIAP